MYIFQMFRMIYDIYSCSFIEYSLKYGIFSLTICYVYFEYSNIKGETNYFCGLIRGITKSWLVLIY